ncbi:MAG: ATP-dependent exoDNAse (exonuclease V) beta subunit [Glaciecola sp.]|jgi:ATP-dependent exoDNAse (exonuclease V) beta subunit
MEKKTETSALLLERLNEHPRDERIGFNAEKHEYFIDGDPNVISVSQIIGEFFPKFDTEFWSKKKAKQRGVPQQQVIDEWADKGKLAADQGTYLHDQIEKYYNGIKHDRNSIEFGYFLKFVDKYPLMQPHRTEWRIFDEEVMLAGTVDMIYKNPKTGLYFMFDWKRSEKVVDAQDRPIKPSYQFAKDDLSHLSDNSYHKYALQQNLYKHLLQKNYGIKISSTNLLVLHPNRHSYQIVSIPEMPKEIGIIMDFLKKKS